jgi:hypothetical protein
MKIGEMDYIAAFVTASKTLTQENEAVAIITPDSGSNR